MNSKKLNAALDATENATWTATFDVTFDATGNAPLTVIENSTRDTTASLMWISTWGSTNEFLNEI